MSKQLKGVGVWLIVLVLMIVGLSYLGEKLQTQNNYSYKELEEDLENHRVAEAVIHQNQQTPTGQLIAVLMNGRSKDMYIDDVKEVRQMLEDANVSYQMTDVPKESKLLSVGVPIASWCDGDPAVYADGKKRRKRWRRKQNDEFWQKPCTADTTIRQTIYFP